MKSLVAATALLSTIVAGSEPAADINTLNEAALGVSIPYRASEQLEYSGLRMGVWRLNGMRESLCSGRFMVKMTCVPPFVPKWAFESQDDAPTMKELDARTLELSAQVEPLFKAACERLFGKVSHEVYLANCSME